MPTTEAFLPGPIALAAAAALGTRDEPFLPIRGRRVRLRLAGSRPTGIGAKATKRSDRRRRKLAREKGSDSIGEMHVTFDRRALPV